MTRMQGMLVAVTVGGLLLGAGPSSAASGCFLGCNMTRKECVQGAWTVKLSCKVGCRETAAPEELGSCLRGCTDSFRTTKREVCRPEHRECIEGCVPPDGTEPDECLMGCGEDLAMCARGVVTDGNGCVRGCRSDPDRLGCLAGCAADAEDGAAQCESNYTSCIARCDGGSPSGAFLE